MRSETQAIKAKKLLISIGINASVNKISSRDGCSFGIAFPEKDYQAVISVLSENGMSFVIASSHK